jgi:predicted amidohydrolase
VGKYRKVHLPGHREHEPQRPFQNLEKRYFEVGDLGFPVFRRSAASWAWRSATIGAGPRLIG